MGRRHAAGARPRVGERHEVPIEDVARGGAGVGRLASGGVVFVPATAAGDRVLVEIVEVADRFCRGRMVELLQASPDRVEPVCPVFGRCGGCDWMHLPYPRQWSIKVRGVGEALGRAGVGVLPEVEEFPAERVLGYRNRIQLVGEGGRIGFRAAGSHQLVAIEGCPVARPEVSARIPDLVREGRDRGGAFQVEVEVLPDGEVRTHWDQGHAAAGFRQVHDEGNRVLQAWISGCVPDGAHVLDLFGGNGNLSLGLAERVMRIDCVDLGPAPGGTGRPDNLRFHREPVLPWVRRLRTLEASPGVAVLDPPRRGLAKEAGEIAGLLAGLGVEGVALVACDPDACGRDLRALIGAGYRLERLAVLDLFPQTHHVETLAWLSLLAPP